MILYIMKYAADTHGLQRIHPLGIINLCPTGHEDIDIFRSILSLIRIVLQIN